MKHLRFVTLFVVVALLAPTTGLGAGIFTDIGDLDLYKGEIESLARSGILNGNPDGKFYPNRSVNRAEFLKILYVATGRTPKAINVKCFVDIDPGSWYEGYVCDAASKENGFVKGYSDGKFRPASPVTRTEAIKMIFMVFGLPAPEISQNDQSLIKFVDISTSAWYSKYISAAYVSGLLPIMGQSGSRFYPEQELLRGEAAAYIFNAQRIARTPVQSSSSSSTASSVASVALSSSSSSVRMDIVKNLAIPFLDTDQFIEKKPAVYLFTITKYSDILLQVATAGYYHSDVTCRLYLLKDDGFSSEYYLGFQESSMCTVKATLRPGKYQFQIQPTVGKVPYTASAKFTTGDGNDGFSSALELKKNLPKTSMLEANDLFDWYAFPVTSAQMATVELTASEKMTCIIYTPESVDQFGFSGPECNKPYLFNTGTDGTAQYVIGIGRFGGDQIHKVPYTLQFHPQ